MSNHLMIKKYLDPVINDHHSGSSELLSKLQNALLSIAKSSEEEELSENLKTALQIILKNLSSFALLLHFINEFCLILNKEADYSSLKKWTERYNGEWERAFEKDVKTFLKNRPLSEVKNLLLHSRSGTILKLFDHLDPAEYPELTLYQSISHPHREGLDEGLDLVKMGWKVIMIEDAVMGKILTKCDLLLLSCDVLTRDTFVNKAGSMPVAATAHLLKIPVDLLADPRKLIDVANTPDSLLDELLTEYPHNPEELNTAPLEALNYYFEHVPVHWMQSILFQAKAYSPEEFKTASIPISFNNLFLELWEKSRE